MAISANLGFPRIGKNRELKKALESFWKGNIDPEQLLEQTSTIRKDNWYVQKKKGIQQIPNCFSMYDSMLDTICTVGAIPKKYDCESDIEAYFAMARGIQNDDVDIKAMEMTKWFDTNYHYIVPELSRGQEFNLSSSKIFDEFNEAKSLGIETIPVVIGPITFLGLGKDYNNVNNDTLDLVDSLLPVYKEILTKLAQDNCKCLQIDEPLLVTDISSATMDSYQHVYDVLGKLARGLGIQIKLTTYFGELKGNLNLVLGLPVDIVHFDLVAGSKQLDKLIESFPKDKVISAGVVDGRNIWINDFGKSLNTLNRLADRLGKDRIIVAPSCSLLHLPVDLDNETKIPAEIKQWLSFAEQKLDEVGTITEMFNNGADERLEQNQHVIQNRRNSKLIHVAEVKDRVLSIDEAMKNRKNSFEIRTKLQAGVIDLPLLPITTIGSFPQTKEVRVNRSDYKKGNKTLEQYNDSIEQEIVNCIKLQEEIGIDVLVHGEFERNDMVEYFGEQLEGFIFTQYGWVQSYGSRCVKPPIIYGDVQRKQDMTVEWTKFAQSKTDKIMKGMLTGPVTILQWSFVRDDQQLHTTCNQVALAIRDEVLALEKAGIKIIQIDEAALREGLPLRKKEWQEYLSWAIESFRVSASGVKDTTQIHTHMCYSEFSDIIDAIAKMDADVISIETSRSNMELLNDFSEFKYPNDIGPGVYDIHSPRIPSEIEIEQLINKALKVIPKEKLWINPDCGLKTRGWTEVIEALKAMVKVTKSIREKIV